jgi:hypothetical protein
MLTLVHRSWISYTLNMEAIVSSEKWVNKILYSVRGYLITSEHQLYNVTH